MKIQIKFNEIKNLTELKENLSENLMLKIFDMKWVDVKGNKLDVEEYKFYNVVYNCEFDLDYLIDNCDYNNFKRIDLMVE